MKNTKKVTATKTASKNAASVTRVHLAKSSYHYWRNDWVRDILTEAGVTSAKFAKEDVGYNGAITVLSTDLVKAKNALDAFKKKNSDTVSMWS